MKKIKISLLSVLLIALFSCTIAKRNELTSKAATINDSHLPDTGINKSKAANQSGKAKRQIVTKTINGVKRRVYIDTVKFVQKVRIPKQ